MTRRIILLTLLIAGLAASCYVAGQRTRVEYRNRAVEIVLDYDEVAQIAAAQAMSPADVLRKFKGVGVTSVAITEDTFRDAVDDRTLMPYGPRQFVIPKDKSNAITSHLKMALPAERGAISLTVLDGQPYDYLTIADSVPEKVLEQLPIGLPADAVKAARTAGVSVVARLPNYPGATPDAIDSLLADVRHRGIEKIIFLGDQVLGFNGAVKETAQAMRANDLLFGRVEFSRQKGEMELAKEAKGNVIVVHSISQNEMPTMDIPSIVERFQRGVRERGVRMCYVRMFYTASPRLLASNADYILQIARSIRKADYTPRASHPLENLSARRPLSILAGVGVAAGAALLTLAVIDVSTIGVILWTLVLVAICGGLAAYGELGRKAVALLSALVFPTLAALNATRCAPESPTRVAHPLPKTIGRLLAAIATACAGGLLIVGLLSERPFMLRVDQFAGVKAAHLAPVLALALLYAGGVAWKSEVWGIQKRKLARTLKEAAANPILWWQIIAVVFAAAVVGLMVLRSGNDSGLEVRLVGDQVPRYSGQGALCPAAHQGISGRIPGAPVRHSLCPQRTPAMGGAAGDRRFDRADIGAQYVLSHPHAARGERVEDRERGYRRDPDRYHPIRSGAQPAGKGEVGKRNHRPSEPRKGRIDFPAMAFLVAATPL